MGKSMCYNCGCKQFEDNPGDPKTLQKKLSNKSADDAKQKALEGLETNFGKK
jgi:hypothetical protein